MTPFIAHLGAGGWVGPGWLFPSADRLDVRAADAAVVAGSDACPCIARKISLRAHRVSFRGDLSIIMPERQRGAATGRRSPMGPHSAIIFWRGLPRRRRNWTD